MHAAIEGLEDAGNFVLRTPNTSTIRQNDPVNLRFDINRLHIFDGETQERFN